MSLILCLAGNGATHRHAWMHIARSHVLMQARTYTCKPAQRNVHAHTHTHTCKHMHTHTHENTDTNTHAHTHASTHSHTPRHTNSNITGKCSWQSMMLPPPHYISQILNCNLQMLCVSSFYQRQRNGWMMSLLRPEWGASGLCGRPNPWPYAHTTLSESHQILTHHSVSDITCHLHTPIRVTSPTTPTKPHQCQYLETYTQSIHISYETAIPNV